MNFIDALQAKWKADELLQKEVRNLLAANPPDSVKCFAKNGLHAFADNGDTTEISEITLAWLTGMENAGAEPSAALRKFLQAESQHNGILRDAKNERAALAGAAAANLDPADLHKRADEWEKIYEAHKGTNPECGIVASDMMQYLHSRATQIQLARPVRMGGDDRTIMTGAEVKRLRDCRGAIVAAAANPPRGLFPPDLRDEWRTRPDLLGLMLSVYLRVPPVNEDGKTFASDSAGAFQIRGGYRGGRAYALPNDGRGWKKPGADIFAVAGKLIGREEKADFPAQAAAVDALIKNARGQNPNALADLREWDSPVSAVAAQISDDKKCYRKISETSAPVARGETAFLRALTPDDVGQCGAGIVGIINLANPTKKDGANRLAGMSDKDIKEAAAAAGGGKSAGYHAFRFLHDSGLLERLRRVRKFWEWTDCIRALKDHAAQSRRWVRLRAALRLWYDALQSGNERFADCIQRDKHAIGVQAKAARCGRDTMRKMRQTLEKGGKLSRVHGDDLRCAFYRLTARPRLAANAVFNALGKMRRKASENIAAAAAFASRHTLPLATAPPLR